MKVKRLFSDLAKRIDGVFYRCEYIKECDKVTVQCWHGGNSYCGEYKKRISNKKKTKQSKKEDDKSRL